MFMKNIFPSLEKKEKEISITKDSLYDFLFSVVVMIKNDNADHLEASLNSIEKQKVGFKENIQLILINNVDNKAVDKICNDKLIKYPNNIVYKKIDKTENIPSLYNIGLKEAKGKYVSFIEGGDEWAKRAFYNVYKLFHQYNDEIDAVSCRIMYTDSVIGNHQLNYKFDENRVSNIVDDFSDIQIDSYSVVYKYDSIKEESFNENLLLFSGADLFNRIVLKKGKYGISRAAVYHKRKLYFNPDLTITEADSITQDMYDESIGLFFDSAISASKNNYGYVIPYVQFLIHYLSKNSVIFYQSSTPYIVSKEISEQYSKYIDVDNYNLFKELNKEFQFSISVVMPVYNTEKYLKEAIDSVINQTLKLKRIQVILVNNATEDNSKQICEEYLKQYPNNFTYVELKENVGPSGARNVGSVFAYGKYVNFMDSDDKWSNDAFKKVWRFFERHKEMIDVVSCRMKYFEARNDYYKELDNKFTRGNRISNVDCDYKDLQLHVTSSFIKLSEVKRRRFDTSMCHLEDSKYINSIIFDKLCYGVMGKVIYNYRRRQDRSSLLNNVRHENKTYFSHTLDNYLTYFVNISKERYGTVLQYVQWMIMYTLGNRLKEIVDFNPITKEEFEDYKYKIVSLLKEVDDRIIMECNTMFVEYKIKALEMKNEVFFEKLYCGNRVILYKNTQIYNLDQKNTMEISSIEIYDDCLHIYGKLSFPFPEDSYDFYFTDNRNNKYQVQYDQYDKLIESLGEVFYVKRGFSVQIPVSDNDLLLYGIINHLGSEKKLHFKFGKWAKINEKIKTSYYVKNNIMISPEEFSIRVKHDFNEKELEKEYQNSLTKEGKTKVVLMRKIAKYIREKNKKKNQKIWLFMDRITSADENAEFLCDYTNNVKNRNIKTYYILSKDSADYNRLKKKFNVVEYNSLKYRILSLIADKSISSVQRLPTLAEHDYIKDLCPTRVYLQHGIVEKDISDTWNRLACNDSLFISSTKDEYDYFIKYKYGLTSREVKLTGMPRQDLLVKYIDDKPEDKKIICFAPTWRENLVYPVEKETKERPYNPYFVDSEFFAFYNNLINDERVLKAMEENGYIGVLQLHPIFHPYADCFNSNSIVKVDIVKKSFVDQYKNTAMVITDYSSIAFEYAFINRLVIYTQFDKDHFYQDHTYKEGYFDYESDGFGPVCYDYEDTVKEIVKAIKNHCAIEEKYLQRRNETFAFFDGKNCERIYNEMLSLD